MDDFMAKVTASATMLLTGFTVVFAVLLLLIFIIYIYGKIVSSAQKYSANKKNQKDKKAVPAPAVSASKPAPAVQSASNDEIPPEIVAVITAAVDSMYSASNSKVRIKSISKNAGARSPWANAGVLDNTKPF